MKLYELSAAYRQLDAALDSDVDDTEVLTMIEQIGDAFTDKAIGLAKVIQNLEATADAKRAAAKRMTETGKTIERRADALRAYLLTHMVASGIHPIECPEFSLKVRENPPSVVIDDETKIPAEYMRQPPPVPDKKAILDDIKQGCVVDGAHAERGKRLEIK